MIWFTVSALYIDFYVVGRAAGLLFCLTTALTLGVVHTYAARCYALLSPARAAGCVAGLSSAMRGGAWDRLREIVVASDTCSATRCCARKSNSMYFSGGVNSFLHTYAALHWYNTLCVLQRMCERPFGFHGWFLCTAHCLGPVMRSLETSVLCECILYAVTQKRRNRWPLLSDKTSRCFIVQWSDTLTL